MTLFPQAIPADLSGTLDGRLLGGRGALAWTEEGIDLRLPRLAGAALEEEPERVSLRWEEIQGIARRPNGLEVEAGPRGRWIAEGDARIAAAAAEVEERLFRIPELTRALRALGSRRASHPDGAAHAAYFAPLLAARREAAAHVAAGDHDAVLRDLASERLRDAMAAGRAALAATTPDGAPRRAMLARLGEACEPLEAAFATLAAAESALRDAGALARAAAWRRWSGALAHLFEMADRCWPQVDATLAERLDAPARSRAPWWRRSRGVDGAS